MKFLLSLQWAAEVGVELCEDSSTAGGSGSGLVGVADTPLDAPAVAPPPVRSHHTLFLNSTTFGDKVAELESTTLSKQTSIVIFILRFHSFNTLLLLLIIRILYVDNCFFTPAALKPRPAQLIGSGSKPNAMKKQFYMCGIFVSIADKIIKNTRNKINMSSTLNTIVCYI